MINLTFQELISSTYSNSTYINSTMNIPKYFPITNHILLSLEEWRDDNRQVRREFDLGRWKCSSFKKYPANNGKHNSDGDDRTRDITQSIIAREGE